ncbi:DUF982 domain-containing protein [Mesorhizobium sp. ArgA1]
MNAETFSSSIFVKRATYMVQEIADLKDAIEFLEQWPEDRRDPIHETALRACYEAHVRRKPVSAARNAFLGFSQRAGIFLDPISAMKWIAACKSGGGKVRV